MSVTADYLILAYVGFIIDVPSCNEMPLPGPLLGNTGIIRAWELVQGGCTQLHSLQDGGGVGLLEPEMDSHLPAGLAMPTSTTIVLSAVVAIVLLKIVEDVLVKN